MFFNQILSKFALCNNIETGTINLNPRTSVYHLISQVDMFPRRGSDESLFA